MKELHAWTRRDLTGWMAFALVLLAVLLPATLMAQGTPHMLTAADRAEVAGFKLNTNVLDRLQAVTSEGRAMHLKKRRPDMSQVHSLDDMAQQLTAVDPRIKPLLARHGFTPHQFVVANMALVRTAMAVRMQQDPRMSKYVDMSKLDPGNLRFYKAHKSQIDAMMGGGADTAGQ
ncbi:hypothetical protein [Oleiagrimonas sp.]|jgi:hypothetical protein|uniref:hypothetical protein n=1 Tax=Oleiagrimonas sp. TaxID=2010330 RepID=UPI00262EAFB4|nr:hypothetical protein [Oleiagrimonas sp.]MDA3913686.1 hypothetical protein [Oleiagrimonas sp.]